MKGKIGDEGHKDGGEIDVKFMNRIFVRFPFVASFSSSH